jgi:serine phosphatase RsbU (regulator of sigma subunit)
MRKSVKHFVGKILGIHLLLLALLLAVVTLAARHLYQSARSQALEQAQARQTSLVSQTAHGVGGFYGSILEDLRLLKPDSDEESDLPSSTLPTAETHTYQNWMVRQGGQLLAQQLAGRAHLFIVDEQMHPHSVGEERPLKLPALIRNGKAVAPATKPSFEQEVINVFSGWLKSVKDADISRMASVHDPEKGEDKSVKLVSIPLISNQKYGSGSKAFTGPRRTGWLVAVISARPIEHNFLSDLGANGGSGAFVVDETMTIMAASVHDQVGKRLDKDADPLLVKMLAWARTPSSAAGGINQSIDRPFRVGDQQFDASMVSAYPVTVMGKQWFVIMASPLQEVDQVVRELSGRALFWAIFVAVSMTAILVSTAAQLILSRMRMERVRHKSLQNEMRQARQIQLAWLPQKTKATCSASMLDIASLNRPATHISGDFYNFFELPDGRTAVIIGDVTGHGTAAAFLMATAQLLVRNTLPQYCDPGRCLEDVNRQLTGQMFNGQFVTMQVLVIDSRTGEVAIATAGHPAPLIGDGESFHPLKIEPQLVAGVDPKTKYPTERFRLRPENSILLYTDGVVETENPAGQCLRLEGLRRALTGRVENAEALLQKAVSAVNTFRHGEDLRDDLTMVAVHLLPQPRPATVSMPLPAAPAKALPSGMGILPMS